MKTNKTGKTLLVLVILIITVSIITCKHEPNPIPLSNNKPPVIDTGIIFHPGPVDGSSGDTIKDSVCFIEELLPIILSNCAKSGCHDANARGELRPLINYNDILQYVQPFSTSQSDLYNAITGNGQDIMPPSGNTLLTTTQIQLIKKWILEGAKQNIDCGMGCDTSLFTYSGAVKLILQNNCTGCHNGGTTGGGISLLDYNSVLVTVNNGKLWGSVNHLQGFYAMPLNSPMLDSCHLKQIRKWIDAGALNN